MQIATTRCSKEVGFVSLQLPSDKSTVSTVPVHTDTKGTCNGTHQWVIFESKMVLNLNTIAIDHSIMLHKRYRD